MQTLLPPFSGNKPAPRNSLSVTLCPSMATSNLDLSRWVTTVIRTSAQSIRVRVAVTCSPTRVAKRSMKPHERRVILSFLFTYIWQVFS